jgi:hypothetical protein
MIEEEVAKAVLEVIEEKLSPIWKKIEELETLCKTVQATPPKADETVTGEQTENPEAIFEEPGTTEKSEEVSS